jgi:phosphohistidine phosphatase SixA
VIARLLFILGLLWPGIALANDWDALKTPGAFAIMRHALAPGTGDPAALTIGDCSTQRNLSQQGRDQATRIGAAFQERGHAFDIVLTSQWCRCRDTAELLQLGPVEEAPVFNSFFQDFSTRDSQTADALALLADRQDRPFVVTHQVNIRALTGDTTRSGEVLIVRHGGDRLDVLGSIVIDP